MVEASYPYPIYKQQWSDIVGPNSTQGLYWKTKHGGACRAAACAWLANVRVDNLLDLAPFSRQYILVV
jgi:hypothetical protein